MDLEFPKEFRFLFNPKRYKFARGGRGSTKSWSFARALLLLGSKRKLRILCTREVQKSIKDSVHRLLCDRIEELKLQNFYEVLNNEIRGKNGTLFLFSGLSDQTVESIKSFEGVDITWIEEAKNVTQKSLDILLPTVLRKPSAEVWATFNPELENDPIYQLAVVNPPPEAQCVSVEVNLDDVLEFLEEHGMAESLVELRELHRKTKAPHIFDNIWRGKCLPAVEGAIYFDEVATLQEGGRIREVPHDPLLKTHAIWDLGWNDSMSIILVQRQASELRVIEYIEDSHRTLADYVADLKAKKYGDQPVNWGTDYLPHDGFSKDFKTGKSAQEIPQALGRTVQQIPKMDVEGGIKAARSVFSRLYLDKDKTTRLVECLKRYRRQINQTTNEPGAPLHDEYSHGADAFRYLALCADVMTNDEWGGPLKYPKLGNV